MKKPLFPPASSLAFCAPQQALDIKNCMNNVGSFLSKGGIMSHIHKTRKYLAITMAVLLAIAVPAQASLAESAVSPPACAAEHSCGRFFAKQLSIR